MTKVSPLTVGVTARGDVFDVEVSSFARAAPEVVFKTLTTAATLAELLSCEVDSAFKVGATIRLIWPVETCGESGHICGGEITALDPPRHFAFTWGQEDSVGRVPWGSSLVEFLVAPEADGSRVTIRHTNLPSAVEAENHHGGWSEYVDVIAAHWR